MTLATTLLSLMLWLSPSGMPVAVAAPAAPQRVENLAQAEEVEGADDVPANLEEVDQSKPVNTAVTEQAVDNATDPSGTEDTGGPAEANEVPLAEQETPDIAEIYGLPQQQDTGTLNEDNWWMPQSASTQAPDTDALFWYVMVVNIFFTVLVVALMVWFVIKYRYRKGINEEATTNITHSTAIEITWTVIPTAIVLVMFVYGFRGYLDLSIAPPNAMDVRVTGRMWNWTFTYPDGTVTNELFVPQDMPVRLILESVDVIHSVYIPAFRVKKDAVPGRFNKMWFEATQPGVYELFCTEYCGTSHNEMVTKVYVFEPEQFREAYGDVTNLYVDFATGKPRPLAEVGMALWNSRGCVSCHSADGSPAQAPTWKNLWMSERQFTDGTTAVADEDYILESIYYPQQKIVAGWGNSMPSFLGSLSDRDVGAIIEYIKTLSDEYKVDPSGDVIGPGADTTSVGSDKPSAEAAPDDRTPRQQP